MSSTNIYPYVYKLTDPNTGKFYIGYRCANKVIAEDDIMKKYFTSSKHKDKLINFTPSIVAVFFDSISAYEFEQQLIYENIHDPLCMNESCFYDKHMFKLKSHTEESKLKISKSRTGIKFSESHLENLRIAMEAKSYDYMTEDYKNTLSKQSISNWSDPVIREKRIRGQKKHIRTDEHRAALSKANIGKIATDEAKQKMRVAKLGKTNLSMKGRVTVYDLLANEVTSVTTAEYAENKNIRYITMPKYRRITQSHH